MMPSNKSTISVAPGSDLDWRGTFRLLEDHQSVGDYVSCNNFEMCIDGVWWPIDWSRFQTQHLECWRKAEAYVRKKLTTKKGSSNEAS